MSAPRRTRKVLLAAIFITLALGLTGCFKGNISVDIQWDGSAIVTVAFGMTPQAQALVGSQGVNPFQDMRKSLEDSSGNIPNNVEVKQWNEGDYNWMSATGKFSNVEQVNKVMENKTLFSYFTISRKSFIIVDEYILDAEIAPLNSDITAGDATFDPSAFINLNFSTRLPGFIMESNGFVDSKDPNLFYWSAQGNQPVTIHARSLSVNWLVVFVLLVVGGGLVIFGVYAFGGFDFMLNPKNKKLAYASPSPRTGPQQDQFQRPQALKQPPNYIVDLGVEDLLNQVNSRALNMSGVIYKKQGEIALVWKDAQGLQKYIDVKDVGNHQITVNGTSYPATRDNAKFGITNVLKINHLI